MKIVDLFEAREGFLYHSMDISKAHNVFSTDMMPARWTHLISGYGKVLGNSFSRNKRLRYNYITITVDQAKLAANNKIIPLDAEYVHYRRSLDHNLGPSGVPTFSDRKQVAMGQVRKTPSAFFQEEFVIGDIKNLHKKIVKIDLRTDKVYGSIRDPSKRQFINAARFIQNYADKYQIDFVVDKKIKYK